MSKFLNKNIIITSIIAIFLTIVVIVSFLIFPKFYVKSFEKSIDINYLSEFNGLSGNVCYGNLIRCNETKVSFENNVDTSTIGTYEVDYKYTFDNKSFNLKQTVNVKDLENPIISIDEENLKYCSNDRLLNYNVSATDNYDGDLTDKIETTLDDGKIIFKVSDSSNNVAVLERDASLISDNVPNISLVGNQTKYVLINSTYNEEGAQATDTCDGDLTENISIEGNVDTSKTGEYQISYSVTNSSGNSNSVTRKVIVYSPNSTSGVGKTIYLTFDDGPSSYTNGLLDVLKKYNVKATFFVTGNGIRWGYASSLQRAYNEGHTIALHSETHDYSYVYSSIDNYFNDLYTLQNRIKELTGYTSTIVRFPGGSSNTVSFNYDGGIRIMTKLSKLLEEKGFRYYDWNISSGDAGATTSTDQVYLNVVNNLKYTNNVVLQHDSKGYSVAAVERIINYGINNGYTFKALEMDSPRCEHGIAN